MTQELLAKTVKEAAKAAHKRLRQVEFRTQAPDHPILWANSANVLLLEVFYLPGRRRTLGVRHEK